ncbi:MAG TPA: FmdB family zinc ribbon protein [Methylomirabilota bacterium]|nr:FmdB family zinc ribbon protein [Methylomirabilota bacterium]
MLTPYPLPCSLDSVPTYEYECNKCRRVFEVRQRISEPALTSHEGCGGEVHRLLSPAPFILKGEGWYVTDYPSEARKKAREAEKPAAEKPAADKPAAEKTAATTAPSAPASSPAPKTD